MMPVTDRPAIGLVREREHMVGPFEDADEAEQKLEGTLLAFRIGENPGRGFPCRRRTVRRPSLACRAPA
jgi:hypothetical protein